MAKIAPKGKKVIGTKKKDSITWLSTKPWKKNLTVYAGAGNDVINFKKSSYKNVLYGEAGKDTIYGGKGNDTIIGGAGNDTINAGKGKNYLYFMKGNGQDTVVNGKGTDIIVLKSEKKFSNIKVAYSGNNVIITYTGGKVILKDYKKGGHSAKYIQIGKTVKAIADFFKKPEPEITVQPGTEEDDNVSGTNTSEVIYGFDGDDTLVGGLGNDTIIGGNGNNTYIYNDGDGFDTIVTTSDGDVIKFNDYSAEDISLSVSDTTVFLKKGDTNLIQLNDFLNPDEITKMEVEYSVGSADSIFKLMDDFYGNSLGLYYAKGNDNVVGTDEHEIFISTNDLEFDSPYNVITPGKGNDRLYSYDGLTRYIINANDGNDILHQKGGESEFVFSDAAVGDLTKDDAYFKIGDDLSIRYDDTDIVTIKDYFTEDNYAEHFYDKTGTRYDFEDYFAEDIIIGTEYADSITGTEKNEIIRGLGGNDTITGGKGNDVITGGAGNNTYVFNKGDGKDAIIHALGSLDTIKFNDVAVTDLDFGYIDDYFAIKYGENDSIRLKNGGIYKIVDMNNDSYYFLYNNSYLNIRNNYAYESLLGGFSFSLAEVGNNLLIAGAIGESNTLRIENSTCNCVMYGLGGDDYFSARSGTNTFVVKKSDTGAYMRFFNNNTIKFADTTLDDVSLSVVSRQPEQPDNFSMYNFRLTYNSGESYINFCNNGESYFEDINLKDYTGTSTTFYEKFGVQKGVSTETGTTGNDFLLSGNAAYGMGGNDIIWGCKIVYGYDRGKKNTTVGDSVEVYGSTTVYAQSETNKIIGLANEANTYYAYIDQKTSIYESSALTSSKNDMLNFTDTSNSDTDGELYDYSTGKYQIHVVFNVSSDYNKITDGIYFGDVSFVDDTNLALWEAGGDYKGITVSNNAIEMINTTDYFYISNTEIADLAQNIATWLTSEGRNYGSVMDVLTKENNSADIALLIAEFDKAQWVGGVE